MAQPVLQANPGGHEPGGSIRLTRRNDRKNVSFPTGRQYADAVSVFSNQPVASSIFCGAPFDDLAQFLNQPYEARLHPHSPGGRAHGIHGIPQYVTLYDLKLAAADREFHISSIEEFAQTATELSNEREQGQLLFIKGQPSAEWLGAIGAKYCVDPAFFCCHLDYWKSYPQYFAFPGLESTKTTTIRLCITTIALSMTGLRSEINDADTIESLRALNEQALRSYQDALEKGTRQGRLGDSVIRDVAILDKAHFIIEQDISVWVNRIGRSWIALIWLDHGHNLSEGLTAPLAVPFDTKMQSWQIRYLPTTQYRRDAALKPRARRSTQQEHTNTTNPNLTQSSVWLDQSYGRDLDRELANSDPLYALQEVLNFAATSESQFLIMIESKLQQESAHRSMLDNKLFTISNLLYYHSILDRHVKRLEQNLKSLNSHDLKTLAPSKKVRKELSATRQRLNQDYARLVHHAQRLRRECSESMQLAMNVAAIHESQKAIIQAEEVTKLTKLAFIFLPLTYITSFFGMNFSELGTGDLNIWVWAVLSLPVLLLSAIMMNVRLKEKARSRLRARKATHEVRAKQPQQEQE